MAKAGSHSNMQAAEKRERRKREHTYTHPYIHEKEETDWQKCNISLIPPSLGPHALKKRELGENLCMTEEGGS